MKLSPLLSNLATFDDMRVTPSQKIQRGLSGSHGKQSPLVVIHEQSILAQLFQQSFDPSALKLDDLLLEMANHPAECSKQYVPWLEQEGHVRLRNRQASGADG